MKSVESFFRKLAGGCQAGKAGVHATQLRRRLAFRLAATEPKCAWERMRIPGSARRRVAVTQLFFKQMSGWLLVCWTFGWPVAGLADEGSDIYRQTCAVCHAVGVPGVPGAPKLGARADWNSRLATGRTSLLHSVLRGKGAMPPKGGNASLSDAQAKAALDYMLSKIGGQNITNEER